MSIVKDLFIISLFIIMLFKYFKLYKDFNSQKKYFIQTLSHDLRVSTIAQIRGLELLSKENNTELVSNINESCKFTLDMITMLLNTYRYENGEQVLSYEKCNIFNLIKDAEKIVSEQMNDKNISLISLVEKNLFTEADKTSFSKSLLIILSTAVFSAQANSVITVSAQKIKNSLEVTINYKGKPLSDEECRRMFNNNPRFSTVGHGIRMHLCKKIIDFHKGEIFVQNLKNDINSFTIKIPLKSSKKYLKNLCLKH